MKHLLLLFTFCSTYSYSQIITQLDLQTKDIVADKSKGIIYASIPGSFGTNGNSIAVIDANTKVVKEYIPIGSEPGKMAISSDGTVLYICIEGTGSIVKYDVINAVKGTPFLIEPTTSSPLLLAEDILVHPKDNDQIVVARKNKNIFQKHQGVAVYKNGNLMPLKTSNFPGSNVIEWLNDSTVVGYNNENNEYGFRTMRLNANGIEVKDVKTSVFTGLGTDFISSNNSCYSTNGKAVSYDGTTVSTLGTYSTANGKNTLDLDRDKIYFASKELFAPSILIKTYSASNFNMTDTISISFSSNPGAINQFISWGNDGKMALATANGKLVILEGSKTTNLSEKIKKKHSIYPNPSQDKIYFTDLNEIHSISFCTIDGKEMEHLNIVPNQMEIDITDLKTGIYLLNINQGEELIRFTKL